MNLGAVAERTLPRMLLRQAERFGDERFVRIAGADWRHADGPAVAASAGAALAALGVAAGDRVALMCGNRAEYLEVFLGCGWIGAIAVPINVEAMGPQIEYLLRDSGAQVLLIEQAFMERLRRVVLASLPLAAIATIDDVQPGARDGDASPLPLRRWPRPAISDADIGAPATVRAGDPLAILYTSGTTGPAKGVIVPHAQFASWAHHTARILGVQEDDVLSTTLPLFHINALNTAGQAMLTGAQAVFESRFSASRYWQRVVDARATVVYLLGAMVPMLLAQPGSEAERAHRVRIGLGPGVPLAAANAFAERTGVRLLDGYGSTETNFVIAADRDAPPDGTMGHVQPGFEARVVDADDAPQPAGTPGELVLRASEPWSFAAGYWGRAEQTVEAWRNGWFHTGDRVVREPDGRFRFLDRLKDAIRRRGENISSYEVEQALLAHPDVAAAAVFPVRSELAEDEVMAALVARAGAALDVAEICAFCAERLPKHAVPRYVDVVEDLPRTANGKVRKFVLRERGVTPTTWDRLAKPGGGD
ncbi:MAG TPA: ATP-dependent acyl-CoA ligase [Caldimonas sp.]|nr:ATP-dependent acyl-CoA ligase [Caldimonas sp.]